MKNLESRVKVNATLDEMDELFNDTQGGFSIRYCERLERIGDNATFKVVVRHGDNIGYQDGKTFDYQSFIEKFDDVELRAKRSSDEKDKITLLETDMNIAERGIEGGLSSKEVAKVLKIYGTHRCKEEKYLKAVMKKIQDKEISLDFGR